MTSTTLPSISAGDDAASHEARTTWRSGQVCFFLLWLFIILVSVVDGYLVLVQRSVLVELNPQGQLLMALTGGEVWGLLAAKFLGTIAACSILRIIYSNNGRAGTAIAAVLATLQFLLLIFLFTG